MPRIVESTVYTIEELSEAARERARAWYRETCLDCEWYDAVYEDFQAICGILGIVLRTSPVRLYGGGTREKPHLYFRGFSSQGDGASFEGSYSHARGAPKGIRAHAPGMRSCTASQTNCRPCRSATFSSYTARSGSAAATATSTPWRSRSSATARPGSP